MFAKNLKHKGEGGEVRASKPHFKHITCFNRAGSRLAKVKRHKSKLSSTTARNKKGLGRTFM